MTAILWKISVLELVDDDDDDGDDDDDDDEYDDDDDDADGLVFAGKSTIWGIWGNLSFGCFGG